MKKFLLPFICITCTMIVGVILVFSGVKNYIKEEPIYKYTLDNVFQSDIMNVASEVNDGFIKPYISDKVGIKRFFYNKNDEVSKQEKSLIYYKNTYIQNKGVDYTSEEVFDIVSVCDGEVTNIESSELYGTVVTIQCNDNLKLVYYNLSNVLVSVGYKVSQGELFATTDKSKFDDNSYLLHFEVKHNDKNIDPESIYSLKISSFN